MEIDVVEDKKNKLVFFLKDSDKTFCNVLKRQLSLDKNVKNVGFIVDHPLVGEPKFILEGSEPKKELNDAVKGLKKLSDNLRKTLKKGIKR